MKDEKTIRIRIDILAQVIRLHADVRALP